MDGDSIASLAYLALLGAAVVGWFFAQNRQSLGKTAQQLVVWALLFLGVIGAYGIWNDIGGQMGQRTVVSTNDRIEIPRRADGHYYISAQLNGINVDFIVDTGATEIVLSQQDATRLGFRRQDLVYLGSATTANGEVRMALITLDNFDLGQFHDRNVRAWVNEGALETSLLGMSYLSRFQSIEIRANTLILTR